MVEQLSRVQASAKLSPAHSEIKKPFSFEKGLDLYLDRLNVSLIGLIKQLQLRRKVKI